MNKLNEKQIVEKCKKANFSKNDLKNFIDFSSSAASYGYITSNSQQYIRDLEVAKLLGQKFPKSQMFSTAENAQNWLNKRLEVNPDNLDQVFRRLQGDGAGEVDVLRKINGSLKGLLFKAKYATNEAGEVANNVPGIDITVQNRFTGEIVEKLQVKSNWTEKANTLKGTIDDFVNNDAYNENIVLVGPKELIDVAKDKNLNNPTISFQDTEHNRQSAERLMKITENGDLKAAMSFGDVATKVGQGALIGAGVAIGVSALTNFLSYKNGDLSIQEAFKNIAKDGAKGGIVGGSLAGLSLVFPPGIIGIGIGIVVGSSLRKIFDLAMGEGEYKEILDEMYADNNLTKGYLDFALTTDKAMKYWNSYAKEMLHYHKRGQLIDKLADKSQARLDNAIEEI